MENPPRRIAIPSEAGEQLLKRNLLALSSVDPQLAARLSRSSSDDSIQFIQSRSGVPVPAQNLHGKLTPLHSRFDPFKEGERYLSSCPTAGYIVFLGLGAGYHVLPFLRASGIFHMLILDSNLAAVKTVLAHVDMRQILMDPRVKILIDPTPEDIKSSLLSHYFPPLAGNLATVSLQNRVNIAKSGFQQAAGAINEVIGHIADDYTVQSRFGKKWIVNTLANLPKASQATQTLSPKRKVMITGAGPSLEDQIHAIRSTRTEGYLIASDTSLPTLLVNGIKPDLVISIDCQQISYHHFLGGYPQDVPLVLDLASPPLLTTLTDKLIFFSSGHPFSQYVSTRFRNFPRIDTSGGNVSHAAVSLAGALGADQITLYGIDFSFPQGKSYARGTYFYPYFRSQESRLRPMETHNFSFLLSNRNIVKEKVGRNICYTTKPMINYKSRLEEAIRSLGVRVVQAAGRGVALDISSGHLPEAGHAVLPTMLSQGARKTDWREFLAAYRRELQHLPLPQEPLGCYWNELPTEEKMLWMTMLPAATAIKEERPGNHLTAVELLVKTKSWTLQELDKRID